RDARPTREAFVRQVPFADGVFTWPADEPRLIGGRCDECAAVTFPNPPSGPRCGSTAVRERPLPRRRTPWTRTTQEFLRKERYAGGETKETFRPFGIGLVQLDDEVRVEGRLTISDPEKIRFGMELELVIIPFRTDPDGTEVLSYAFRPA